MNIEPIRQAQGRFWNLEHFFIHRCSALPADEITFWKWQEDTVYSRVVFGSVQELSLEAGASYVIDDQQAIRPARQRREKKRGELSICPGDFVIRGRYEKHNEKSAPCQFCHFDDLSFAIKRPRAANPRSTLSALTWPQLSRIKFL